MTYTQQEIDEITKCSNDPIYFIETYVKRLDTKQGAIPLVLYPKQRYTIRDYHYNRRVSLRDRRQAGVTQSLVAYMTWWMIFNSLKTSMILADKETHAKEILSRILFTYDNLPDFLKKTIITKTKTTVEFEDGIKIISHSASTSAIRGMALDMLVIDNFDYVQRHISDELYDCVVPTLTASNTAKFITVSTG